MLITSIDGVISRLNEIAAAAETNQTRDGYFAVLYSRMTRAIRENITAGGFEDGNRMERLDVRFANRYFDAYDAFRNGRALTRSWRHVFEAEQQRCPLVFQHLLLGINAHINLDLGIATALEVGSAGIADVRADFMQVNAILRGLIDTVQDGIGDVSPAFKPLDKIFGRLDEEWFAWALTQARDNAWALANTLASTAEEERAAVIDEADRAALRRGEDIVFPGFVGAGVIRLVGLFESRNVPRNIHILRSAVAAA